MPIEHLRATRAAWPLLIVPVVYGVIALPDARGLRSALTSVPISNTWDNENIATWNALSAQGYLQMRDFWYPYGNMIIFTQGVMGAFLWWACIVGLLAVAGAAFSHLAGGRRWPALVGTATLALFQFAFPLGGVRYLLPAIAVLWFAATRHDRGWRRVSAVSILVLTPWLALDMGFYAMAGALAAIVVDEWSSSASWRGDRLPRLRCEVLAGTASAALLLGLLAATGRVATSLEVILHLTDVTAADALGTPRNKACPPIPLLPSYSRLRW